MHLNRHTFLAVAALGCALAAPLAAQETGATEAPATEAAPAAPAPAAETPAATPAPAPAAPQAAPAAPATPAPPPQPEIAVTEHGDWDVGCLAGTTNCEMQQVAADPQGNPVMLVRVIKLPEGSDAQALAIFNTPLGTLLPPGLGFQIDTSPASSLPFEWCVQEGCIVRLGLRDPDIAALKRGRAVKLTVISIADAENPVSLNLSLTGFTAGYDSLTAPAGPAAPANPQAQPGTPPAPEAQPEAAPQQ